MRIKACEKLTPALRKNLDFQKISSKTSWRENSDCQKIQKLSITTFSMQLGNTQTDFENAFAEKGRRN